MKTIELIKKKMHKKQIHMNLYQIEYEVQFRNPEILKILFPIESNHKRYEAAIKESRAMYLKNYRKARWSIERADISGGIVGRKNQTNFSNRTL